jgi:hypothetical protein
MAFQNRATYDEIARRLEAAMPTEDSWVLVVDGRISGIWLEVQIGYRLFDASDREMNWGVCAYRLADATHPTEHVFEGMGAQVYILENYEDGPNGDTATVDEIVAFLVKCGMTEGEGRPSFGVEDEDEAIPSDPS